MVYVQLLNHRVDLCKDSNIGHSVTYDIKKMYSMRDKYTLKIIKTSRVMLKINMLCRVEELFRKL